MKVKVQWQAPQNAICSYNNMELQKSQTCLFLKCELALCPVLWPPWWVILECLLNNRCQKTFTRSPWQVKSNFLHHQLISSTRVDILGIENLSPPQKKRLQHFLEVRQFPQLETPYQVSWNMYFSLQIKLSSQSSFVLIALQKIIANKQNKESYWILLSLMLVDLQKRVNSSLLGAWFFQQLLCESN